MIWNIIKFVNKRLNEMLRVRMTFLVWLRFFPEAQRVHGADLLELDNWGSAPPEYANAFDDSCAATGLRAVITTYRKFVTGRGWEGQPVDRGWVSGCIRYPDISTKGKWKVAVEFSPTSYGHWEAIWFLSDRFNGGRYREVDIERCNPSNNREILISVHDGKSSTLGRRLYNHQYVLPNLSAEFTFKLRPFTRIYLNGILIFVGLQAPMPKLSTFILNSGILKETKNYATSGVFKINGITHIKR